MGRRAGGRKSAEDEAYQHAQAVGSAWRLGSLLSASNARAEVALNAGRRDWRGLDRDVVEIVQQSLRAKSGSEADFWSVVGEIELRQYEALAKGKLASARQQLDKAYQDLHERVRAPRMWASVYDTACLVLPNYADRVAGQEKAVATGLFTQLRTFAYQEAEP